MFGIAYAEGSAAATTQQSGWYSYIMIIAVLGLMYFLMIRPQNKKEKETRAMRSSLKPGDEIITIGGIVGTIARVKEDSDKVVILVGADRTKLELLKTAIAQKITQDEKAPVKSAKGDKKEEPDVPAKPNKKNIKRLGAAKETVTASEAQPEAPAEKTEE